MLEEQISFIDEHDNRDEIFESVDIPTRNSSDQGKNSSGKRLIEIMSDANLLCLNGRKLGDTIGRLTCHEYNGSSTVDLALCSWDIYNQIQYFKVLDPVWYSDHCPIQLTIQTENFFEDQPIDMDQLKTFLIIIFGHLMVQKSLGKNLNQLRFKKDSEMKSYFSVMVNKVTRQTLPLKTLKIF